MQAVYQNTLFSFSHGLIAVSDSVSVEVSELVSAAFSAAVSLSESLSEILIERADPGEMLS